MNKAIAYVDGSYKDGVFGWGFILKIGKDIITKSGGDNDIYKMRNVSGELVAVCDVINECIKNDIKQLDIFYDYAGIEKWATGEWQTKHPVTKAYKYFVNNSIVNVKFNKVKGHSGVIGNEIADRLAKLGMDMSKKRK